VAALSLIEIVFVLGVAATLGEVAIPETLSALDDMRAAGAARYVSTRLQRMRMEAITRNSAAALRFTPVAGQYSVAGSPSPLPPTHRRCR
jgi:Tfp pilus assembly protein FimT